MRIASGEALEGPVVDTGGGVGADISAFFDTQEEVFQAWTRGPVPHYDWYRKFEKKIEEMLAGEVMDKSALTESELTDRMATLLNFATGLKDFDANQHWFVPARPGIPSPGSAIRVAYRQAYSERHEARTIKLERAEERDLRAQADLSVVAVAIPILFVLLALLGHASVGALGAAIRSLLPDALLTFVPLVFVAQHLRQVRAELARMRGTPKPASRDPRTFAEAFVRELAGVLTHDIWQGIQNFFRLPAREDFTRMLVNTFHLHDSAYVEQTLARVRVTNPFTFFFRLIDRYRAIPQKERNWPIVVHALHDWVFDVSTVRQDSGEAWVNPFPGLALMYPRFSAFILSGPIGFLLQIVSVWLPMIATPYRYYQAAMQLFVGNEEKLKRGWLFGIREEVRAHFLSCIIDHTPRRVLRISAFVTGFIDILFRRFPDALLVRDLLYLVNELDSSSAEKALAEAVFGPEGRDGTFREYVIERLGTQEARTLMEKISTSDVDPVEVIARMSFRRRFSGSIQKLIDEAHLTPTMSDGEIVKRLRQTALYTTYAQGYSFATRRAIEALLIERIRSRLQKG